MQQNYDLQNYYKTNMDTRDVIVKKTNNLNFTKVLIQTSTQSQNNHF